MALKMFSISDSICDGADGARSAAAAAADSGNFMYEKSVSETDCDW